LGGCHQAFFNADGHLPPHEEKDTLTMKNKKVPFTKKRNQNPRRQRNSSDWQTLKVSYPQL